MEPWRVGGVTLTRKDQCLRHKTAVMFDGQKLKRKLCFVENEDRHYASQWGQEGVRNSVRRRRQLLEGILL